MVQTVSKSHFKARAHKYFREVERTGEEVVITDRGKPVLKLTQYAEKIPTEVLRQLCDSVLSYEGPTEPVGVDDWENLR